VNVWSQTGIAAGPLKRTVVGASTNELGRADENPGISVRVPAQSTTAGHHSQGNCLESHGIGWQMPEWHVACSAIP
jgi:hypothetical protein